MDIVNIFGTVIFTSVANVIKDVLIEAVQKKINLYGANLYGANLYGANLYGAELCGANLCGANLRGANLYGANLRGANLRGANLRGADLCGADLCGADLCGANLRGANLYGANGEKVVIDKITFFSSSAYPHECFSVLFVDGSKYLRMGCLYMTLEQWDYIGIKNSNPSEFPDDGSDKSEDRAALFNLAMSKLRLMSLAKEVK